jgi:cytochrome P450
VLHHGGRSKFRTLSIYFICIIRFEISNQTRFKGTETTALTISYMALLLAQNPTIQEKLFEEINAQYPTFDEPLTLEILNRMTYLELAIKETLRLIPIVPFLGREVKEDFDLGPCTVKPGMLVAINVFSLHRRKDIWGEDAEEYNPDRFLRENVENRHPFSFIPFSAGARNCIGKIDG